MSRAPNIEKLKKNSDVDGLIKALEYVDLKNLSHAVTIIESAAAALGQLRDDRALAGLLKALNRLDGLHSEIRGMRDKISFESGVAMLTADIEMLTHAIRVTKTAFLDIVADRDIEAVTEWATHHPGEPVPVDR
jgi:HEAT repeat protein